MAQRRAAMTARAGACARGCSASSTIARSTHSAAGMVDAESRDVSDDGIAERMAAPERTETEVERREEAREVRTRARRAAASSSAR